GARGGCERLREGADVPRVEAVVAARAARSALDRRLGAGHVGATLSRSDRDSRAAGDDAGAIVDRDVEADRRRRAQRREAVLRSAVDVLPAARWAAAGAR